MHGILTRRNQRLLHDVGALREALVAAVVPAELEPYRERIVRLCDDTQTLARRNITFLGLNEEGILEDVLSAT